MAYAPTILFVDEWFVRRKGFAFGVMWVCWGDSLISKRKETCHMTRYCSAGTGLAGVVLRLVMEWALHKYGFHTLLRTWSVALFALTAPLLHFLKPRLPVSQTTLDFTFLKSATFGVLQSGDIIESLGHFLPTIYLPTYARSLGASSLASTLTVILFNVASVVGCLIMGSIVDKYHVITYILLSAIGSTGGVFLFWVCQPPCHYCTCLVWSMASLQGASAARGLVS